MMILPLKNIFYFQIIRLILNNSPFSAINNEFKVTFTESLLINRDHLLLGVNPITRRHFDPKSFNIWALLLEMRYSYLQRNILKESKKKKKIRKKSLLEDRLVVRKTNMEKIYKVAKFAFRPLSEWS